MTARRTICRSGQVYQIFFFQNIALLFPPQERILVNRFGSRGLSKFVLETWIRKCIDREGLGRRAKLYPFIQPVGANVMWVHYIREVSNNDSDGLLRKRHLKSRAASNFIALIPSRLIRQMLAIFFFLWRWILTDCVKIMEKKKEVVVLGSHRWLVFTSSKKREIGYIQIVVVQWRQRNVQKSVMHVQSCCFANLNQLFFLPFSLMSPFYCHMDNRQKFLVKWDWTPWWQGLNPQ